MSDIWAAEADTLGAGARIADRYRILRVLGEGGMGMVFEVEHESLGRRFALKVLRPMSWTEELSRRFQREARALGRLTSARIVQVTDFGIDPRVGPFYVMELLAGETLDRRLAARGRLSMSEVLRIGIELCQALEEVHAAGIVHRDLKPANIGLVDGTPSVKLLDFGLAVGLEGTDLARLTIGQGLFGTVPYMSPEQCRGEAPAPGMDLYAVGIILFELITGELPFRATSALAVVAKHLNEPPPAMRDVAPEVTAPAWLEAVVRRLLAKDPADRFPDVAAVAAALFSAEAGTTRTSIVPAPSVVTDVTQALPARGARVAPPTDTPLDTAERSVAQGRATRRRAGLYVGVGLLVAGATALVVVPTRPEQSRVTPDEQPAPATAPAPIATPIVTPLDAGRAAPVTAIAEPPALELPRSPMPEPKRERARARPQKAKKEWQGEILDAP